MQHPKEYVYGLTGVLDWPKKVPAAKKKGPYCYLLYNLMAVGVIVRLVDLQTARLVVPHVAIRVFQVSVEL